MPAAASIRTLCFSHIYNIIPTHNTHSNTNHPHLTIKPKSVLPNQLISSSSSSSSSLDQFKEKILCLEIMGVDTGRAMAQNPSLTKLSLESIHGIVSFLQSKGIHQKDMGRIFGMCPKILTSDIKHDLLPVFQFLKNDLGVPPQNYRKVIIKCPRLLVSSVRDQLKPALFYLQRLGFEDIEALAYQDSVLLVSSVENTLIPKMEFLVSLGFSREDVLGMVVRCPGLFTFSVENNFKPKFEYFVEEMEGKLEELKEFPQFFTFSLDNRIKPRHEVVVENGLKEFPLPLMLKTTGEEFRRLIWSHKRK